MGGQVSGLFCKRAVLHEERHFKWRSVNVTVTLPKPRIVNQVEFLREQKATRMNVSRLVQAESTIKTECTSNSILLEAPGFLLELPVTVETLPGTSGHYRLGLVQAIPTFSSSHVYTDDAGDVTGRAHWELTNKECLDCDCKESSPFYGSRSYVEFGSVESKQFFLFMDDVPFTRASWGLDLAKIGYPGSHILKEVERKQKFVIWLVIEDISDGVFEPLLAIEREINFHVSIDNPLTKRSDMQVKISSRCSTKCQSIVVAKRALPVLPTTLNAKQMPTANEAMRFYWRGARDDKKSLLVPGVRVNSALT